MRRAGLHKAWSWWCDHATERRRQSSLLDKMQKRLMIWQQPQNQVQPQTMVQQHQCQLNN
jgi:hypothetical protein